MAHFDSDEWQLVLADPATNYRMLNHTAAVISNHGPRPPQPVLVVDAEHIETKLRVRLTIRVPLISVRALAQEFTLMADNLEPPGAPTS